MKTYFAIAAGVLIASSGLRAQMDKTAVSSFQVLTNSVDGGVKTVSMKTVSMEPFNSPVVTGKAFSGTEERHTVQILGDGTRIEKTETDRLFRDNQGRTRTERPDGVVIINDPSMGITAETNTTNKSSHTMIVRRSKTDATKVELDRMVEKNDCGGGRQKAMITQKTGASPAGIEENLGAASVNGMVAQGARQTTTIEPGQIGNDRPIRIVSERWYSSELQMLIKSSNSDPRFGETTYQLMNISLAVPDAALFQMPTEHKVGSQ